MCFYSLYHSGSFDLLDKDHDGLSLGEEEVPCSQYPFYLLPQEFRSQAGSAGEDEEDAVGQSSGFRIRS